MRFLPLLLLLAAPITACSSMPTTPTAPPATGTWSGVIVSTGQSLSVTLNDVSGTVTGSGTLSFYPDALALTIVGTYTDATATLTMTTGLHPAIQLRGTVTGKTMAASLTGSGFTADAVTLTRP